MTPRAAMLGLAWAAAALASGCGGPAQAPPPAPPGAIPAGEAVGTASIRGRAVFTGEAPAPRTINMQSDAACLVHRDGEPSREDLVVGEGGALRFVFVHVVSGLGDRVFAPPATPVVLEQHGCIYRPHVAGLQAGQPLEIVNADPTLHNVHAMAAVNRGFNFGMSVQGQRATRYFNQPEVMVKLKCDVHPWMSAYVGVTPHPFHAVTGPGGLFSLEGLPEGDYVVEAWHETLGVRRTTVTLGEGENSDIAFIYD